MCDNCNGLIIWFNKEIVYPKALLVEEPIEDMFENVKVLYLQATRIVEIHLKGHEYFLDCD